MKVILSLTLCSVILLSFGFSKKPNGRTALKTLQGFCAYVPSGNVVLDGDTSSVQAFYMSKTEITNIQYNEFLASLKSTGQLEKYELAKIDSTKWVNSMGYGKAYQEHYHNHPAYREYPVVNISKEGAQLFCEWLTSVYDSISGGELSLKFRIPTRAEYIRAARGDHHDYTYSWGGPFIRNKQGLYLANHLAFGGHNITKDQETGQYQVVSFPHDQAYYSDNTDVLAPAESYFTNELGFYNLNGNASELISDGDFVVGGDWKSPGYDIRIESKRKYNGPESTIGFRVVASYMDPAK